LSPVGPTPQAESEPKAGENAVPDPTGSGTPAKTTSLLPRETSAVNASSENSDPETHGSTVLLCCLVVSSSGRRSVIELSIKDASCGVWPGLPHRGPLDLALVALINKDRGDWLARKAPSSHIRHHVLDPKRKPNSEQTHAADEVIDMVKTYLR